MSTIETSHGSTVPASEIAARFAVALRRVAKWIRNSRSAIGQQPAYRLPLDARLLRDVGICDPEAGAQAAIEADALSSHGLNAHAFLERMRRDCLRGHL